MTLGLSTKCFLRAQTPLADEVYCDLVCAAGLEPATSCVTGRRSKQMNYAPANSVKMTSRSLHSRAVSCTAFHVLRSDGASFSAQPSRLWMFHAGRASERPGLRDRWPTRLLANFWQNGFLMRSPLEG